jgi:hypothetical protein
VTEQKGAVDGMTVKGILLEGWRDNQFSTLVWSLEVTDWRGQDDGQVTRVLLFSGAKVRQK